MVTGDRSWRQWTVGGAPACPEFAAHSDDLKSARSQLGGGLTLHPPPSLRGESPPYSPRGLPWVGTGRPEEGEGLPRVGNGQPLCPSPRSKERKSIWAP
jgi:hypothetical protein